MLNTSYRHTQIGYPLIAVIVVVNLLVMIPLLAAGIWAASVGVLLAMIVIGTVFSTMTIAVSDDRIEWWLTFGLLKQSIPRSSIRAAGIIAVHWTSGLGIRTANFRDFLWIVGGSTAVKLELHDGRMIALGSDDANALLHALSGSA